MERKGLQALKLRDPGKQAGTWNEMRQGTQQLLSLLRGHDQGTRNPVCAWPQAGLPAPQGWLCEVAGFLPILLGGESQVWRRCAGRS